MKKLPVGIESFKQIQEDNYYYVDKTLLIKDIVNEGAAVTLFTRPRRFGKTLNMDTLKSFFEIGANPELFKGLAISKEEKICKEHLGKYPVIFMTFKGVNHETFSGARSLLVSIIKREAAKYRYILKDDVLDDYDKSEFRKLLNDEMSDATLYGSLKTLSELLCVYHKQKVIVLLDEYDVPLDKAYNNGYYDKMLVTMRELFNNLLKTNYDNVKFAILTGCLRISKESIFTGLNNFNIRSISDSAYDEYFGLTDSEVIQILQEYRLTSYLTEAKEWYDGYLFGKKYVYCPWSIIKYVNDKISDKDTDPGNYWANSSGNDIIIKFLNRTDFSEVPIKFEKLVNGGSITQKIHNDLTYNEVMDSEENLWSLLYTSGYLTKIDENAADGRIVLRIPNKEVMKTFRVNIDIWMRDKINSADKAAFFEALWNKNCKYLTVSLSKLLFNAISYNDYNENFYHAILVGMLLAYGYAVESNKENGLGRSDIVVKDIDNLRAIVIETKISKTAKGLDKKCDEALQQIKDKMYSETIKLESYYDVIEYGIAFFQKSCLVKAADDNKIKEMNIF